jgi:hypothetical protein
MGGGSPLHNGSPMSPRPDPLGRWNTAQLS